MTNIERIRQHLIDYGSITSWEAITEYGCTRLSAVIFKLKNEYGLNIEASTEIGKNRYGEVVHYARYSIQR